MTRPTSRRLRPLPHTGATAAARRARRAAARFEAPAGFRKGFGSPALFGIVQCFVAASVYFGLGLVAERAQALTWLVFLAAALFFVALVLSYMEGASLHQERGGATVIARYAFNELWSFIAGWAICLDYVILIAITAFAAGDYAAVFWAPLGQRGPQVVFAVLVIAAVSWFNIREAGPRRYDNIALLVLADLVLQVTVVLLGLALLFEPRVITAPATLGEIPSIGDFLFAMTLAIVAFSGIDASSGLAGQVRIGRRGLRRLLVARLAAAVVPLIGIALVASSTMPLREINRAGGMGQSPVLAVVGAFDHEWLREPLRYLVAVSAVAILVAACNAATLGLSRLGYSLALNRQIPSSLGRLHPRFATPSVLITCGAVLAIVLLLPADLDFLAGLYAFGATISFMLVHLGVLVLRRREPGRDRPFKIPLNVRLFGVDWPLPAVAGLVLSILAFGFVVGLHSGARILGTVWMVLGLTLYVTYRKLDGKPLLRRVLVPEEIFTRREEHEGEYGSILVPVFGTPLDDDIVQTAGRLSAEEGLEEGEGGAVIEALWVFEVPLAKPIDAAIPAEELSRARRALARAKAVGEEYTGVEVATATVRGRRAGEAIVREARRRGVEAIVLAAEEPSSIRGGPELGGQEGLRDRFVGETTRYVVNKAPCRVILTAPPARPGERRASIPHVSQPSTGARRAANGRSEASGVHAGSARVLLRHRRPRLAARSRQGADGADGGSRAPDAAELPAGPQDSGERSADR
ncbi:MAG: amino acid permease [Actinomycetota bacterium]|nr:amino acid permease [Actinomycetota bacterium]